MTVEQLRSVWKLHHGQGLSVNAIAGQIWERFGYASQASCCVSLSRGLRREGLYMRDQSEGTRLAVTKHGAFAAGPEREQRVREYWRARTRAKGGGRRCHGVKTRGGQPCGSWAVPGTDYCFRHGGSV